MSKLSDLLNSQPVTARQAAEVADKRGIPLPYGTIAAYWSGRHGRPSARTLERLAEVLAIPLTRLQMAAWNRTAPAEDWTPPPEVRLLDDRQRRALDELIRSFAATQGESNEEVTQQGAEEGSTEYGSTGRGTRRTGAPMMLDLDKELAIIEDRVGRGEASLPPRDLSLTERLLADAILQAFYDIDPAAGSAQFIVKARNLIAHNQGAQVDYQLAQRKGLTQERQRRLVEIEPEDESQDAGDESDA